MSRPARFVACLVAGACACLSLGIRAAALPAPSPGPPLAPPPETTGAVRFVSPRPLATVVGSAVAELAVVPPPGTRVVRVRLLVDGKAAGERLAPPWTFPWNAGDGSTGHALVAVATFSDGTEGRTGISTSRLQINSVEEVSLVNVYAIVRDARGRYVDDLAKSDFAVSENGRPQKLDRFSSERRPLRVAIVLDTSHSMGEGKKLQSAIDAAVEFLAALEPGDEGLVIGFSDGVKVLQGLTSDHQALETAIRGVKAAGGTALYDAIDRASESLARFEGRRVLLLLSDGRDEAANGLEPGSLHTLEEARDRALHEDVMIFVIGLGRSLAKDARALKDNPDAPVSEMDFYGRRPLAEILTELADTTGGVVEFSPSAGELRRSFESVADDLRHQYTLAYAPLDRTRDGSWRAIKVTVDRPGVTVTNRKGYFAPSDKPRRRGTPPPPLPGALP